MEIVIVGAGPVGLLLGLNLCRGENNVISIFEQRADPRVLSPSQLRTFPIGLKKVRGLEAMETIPGLVSDLEKIGTWTHGSVIHDNKNGKTRKILSNLNLTMDRNNMTLTLLNKFVTAPLGVGSSLNFYFDTSVEGLNLEKKTIETLGPGKTMGSKHFDILIACDGARSKVRDFLVSSGLMKCETKLVDDVYRSIYLSKKCIDNSSADLAGDCLHSWVFGDKRVIASPSINKTTFSGVFIFPPHEDPFENLANGQAVLDYFFKLSPGSLWKYMTLDEADQLLKRPTSNVISVEVDRLHVGDSILLLGDAAHAVSASLGQGCNAALEDVRLFCNLLDESKQRWPIAMEAFTKARLADVHALNELSTYSVPRTSWMRFEWIFRSVLSAVLPNLLKKFLLRPMPGQLVNLPGLTYSDILKKSRWWTDRIKSTHK